jgi:hypothetical protein
MNDALTEYIQLGLPIPWSPFIELSEDVLRFVIKDKQSEIALSQLWHDYHG